MHALWERGVAELRSDQVDHVERDAVLPIAHTLVHYVRGEDLNAVSLLGAPTLLWDGHVAGLRYTGVLPERGTPLADAMRIRIGDLDAWRAYQRAVFARTEALLASAEPAALDRPLFDGRRPASLDGSFLGAYVPSGPILARHACEAFLFAHGMRHLGELEHARALVGLGGLS